MSRPTLPIRLSLTCLDERITPAATDFDTTFANAGRDLITTLNGQSIDRAVDVQRLADGRIVVLTSTASDVAVIRLDTAGKVDTTFGNKGLAVVAFDQGGLNGDVPTSLAITDDGKILITANVETATTRDFGIARFNANGSLDTTFGTNGKTVVDLLQNDVPVVVIPQADGRILVGGTLSTILNTTPSTVSSDLGVIRLTRDGALDTTFGIGGKRTIELPNGANGQLGGMFLDNDQRLMIAATNASSSVGEFVVARLTTSGQPDASFDGDGIKNVTLAGTTSLRVADFIRQTDGRMLAVLGVGAGMAVARLTTAGDPDSTFDGDGFAFNNFPVTATTGSSSPSAGALDSAGRITVFGQAVDKFGGAGVVWRFTSTGAIDTSFGADGRTGFTFSDNGFLNPNNIAAGFVQPDGAIVAVGGAQNAGAGIARLQGTFAAEAYAVGADAGGGSSVVLAATSELISAFEDGFTGGVRVAQADINGDGIDEILLASGPGRANFFRILDGATRRTLTEFSPFEASFTGGLFISTGDINGDSYADFAISPDEGGGPRVRVFDGRTLGQIDDFLGIDDPNFRGGARSAIADLNADGRADLLVAAGFGGGPRLAAYNGIGLGIGLANRPKLFGDIFVFEQTLRNGVYITGGDLDGDGFAEVIVGGGPGGGPRVLALSGKDLVQSEFQVVRANFFAGDVNSRSGVRVVTKRLTQDNRDDILTGVGPGASTITAYDGAALTANGQPSALFSNEVFPGFGGGVFVG